MHCLRAVGHLRNQLVYANELLTRCFSIARPSDSALQEFRESVEQFARTVIAPHAEHVDRNNSFPSDVDLWHEMGNFGLLGITAPEEYGGLEMGYQAHCIAMEELSRASGSVGLSYGAHSNLCVNQLVRNANQQQKMKYLPKLISGEHSICIMLAGNQHKGDMTCDRLSWLWLTPHQAQQQHWQQHHWLVDCCCRTQQ
eukprot:GHRR01014104.1.p1 GENE.GHRR01014104.1~~GHRR01014104.1.p1  ORF type:complete len:198 (+),score=29.96 GHRR01014104.1:101-694(+)